MHVKILGSAAGGGFPQWNCGCRNCRSVRAGNFPGKARTQAQLAVSADGTSWFLLGASPDLGRQIENTAELQPGDGVRHSPISGAVLASADLDHVLGLLLLRELQPLQVYATPSVLNILREHNSMFRMLNRVPNQVVYNSIQPGKSFSLGTPSGEDSGLKCTGLSLGTRYPSYVVGDANLVPSEALLGLVLESHSGGKLVYAPAVPELTESLLAQLEAANVILLDGTFWSEDELIRVQGSGQSAKEMGHVPVGAPEGSLHALRKLRRPRKIYIHVNNTNPMLDESGPEFGAVREAGWEIAEDGWQLTL
ncbi:MAG TPA: pyrroloquinoline quinone biosynthesis protein PqqB [Terriglobales bacterium]|nr:pyrroloquinoline quinone biosynthesis protein PqqB [Terriglobales bacterium]